MTMSSKEAIYPLPANATEASRLRDQQTLFNKAVGFLNAKINLETVTSLRILDSATADGAWLEHISTLIPPYVPATLIGTDISANSAWKTTPFGPPADGNANPPKRTFHFQVQDIRQPWPESWKGTFDLVHQKAALSVIPSDEDKLVVVQNLVDLVKPGGWIQIDDGSVPAEPITDDDTPFEKLLKYMGLFMIQMGLDRRPIDKLKPIFEVINGVVDVGYREGLMRIGGAEIENGDDEELKRAGRGQVEGFLHSIGGAMVKMDDPVITREELSALELLVMEQMTKEGGTMVWSSIWARKV